MKIATLNPKPLDILENIKSLFSALDPRELFKSTTSGQNVSNLKMNFTISQGSQYFPFPLLLLRRPTVLYFTSSVQN